MPQIERRSFLRGTVAAMAVGTAVISPQTGNTIATASRVASNRVDPLKDLLAAYDKELRELAARLEAEGDDMEMEQPILHFLQHGRVPAATTRETAVNALRLACAERQNGFGDPLIGNLVEAALAFFETHTA